MDVQRLSQTRDYRVLGRFWRAASAVGAAAVLVFPTSTTPAAAEAVQSLNLLTNAGAELGDPSLAAYSSVSIPGWTVTGTPTVIRYGTTGGFPTSATGPPDGGAQFFGGGNVATSTLSQTVDLSGAAAPIDAGTVPFTLSGWLGGYLSDPSAASLSVQFLGAGQSATLGTATTGAVGPFDRLLSTRLLRREVSGIIPAGTRSARVVLLLADSNPAPEAYNNAYADNLSFTVKTALPAPPPPEPPVSKVGGLDHVFMVYLENHSVKDVVGSPNMPYLNSLINQYGFGSNYFALTHPSDPNYTPILGGSDFGVHRNCSMNCFDQHNLPDILEAAGKTWAGYAQNMPSPCFTGSQNGYGPDSLPFLAFHNIVSNTARCQAHVLPLPQMATDLASTATTPNFVWFAGDENTNGEGPLGVQFALSQLGSHQFNLKAADEFLQSTLPTILNSPAFQTQRTAVFITFDEDYDNLQFGIGNDGNNVPTVVIPSPYSGMRQGHFVATAYNNHYSLLRTIEDALGGLPRLTNNDRYAQPMNEYWP